MRTRRRTIGRWGLLLVLMPVFGLGTVGCGAAAPDQRVTVLGPWTGDEKSAFLAMIEGFEKTTGISVHYVGTRDADAVLASRLKNGKPPELAVLPTPGELRHRAAGGTLIPLDDALDQQRMATEYAPGWPELMQANGPSGARHYYAIVVKAALKSAIWYSPKNLPPAARAALTSPNLTWSRLNRLTASLAATGTPPWCIGMEDASSSGWPGTDWVEDIVLHQAGPQLYDRWVAGTLPWTSSPVRRAWQTFGTVTTTPGRVRGGLRSMLSTNFGRAGRSRFTSPPGCFLEHQGSFITGFYGQHKLPTGAGETHPKPGVNFAFVPFPPVTTAGQGSQEVAGDLLGMFRDTPAARKLIAYLTTPAAQAALIKRPRSSAISVNRRVAPADYPDPVSRSLAKTLTSAREVRFDASDSMPRVMATAFNRAVLEYISNPAQLDVLLEQLEKVRKAVY
jgi:alpha-glucoside transport system substrate-binding protein